MDNRLSLIICDCGQKTVQEAIILFQNTDLPYKKAKKLVTGCDKSCCREPLMKLFDQVYFNTVNLDEIETLIEKRHNRLKAFFDDIGKA